MGFFFSEPNRKCARWSASLNQDKWIKRRWSWDSSRDDLECVWQRCSHLAASQNGSFTFSTFGHHGVSFHSPDFILGSVSAPCRLISPPAFFFLSEEPMVGCWESVPCLTLSLPELKNHISCWFDFSYATVRGLITSWRGTSHQLEASYLWQLLSNCCFWTMTAPHPPLSLWDQWWPVGDSDSINCTIMVF